MSDSFMEDILTKSIASLGSAGVVAAIMWTIAKRFMDETVKQMTGRIESLERATDECAKDRRQMHSELLELARRIHPDAMDRSKQ
jgi:gamma-glutamyl:cysteine ligase YbdK (ATP-grasp superfamily)